MYCIKCGVKLSEGQAVCPLCRTRVYHPEFHINEESTYPKIPFKSEEFNRKGLMFVITMIMLIPLLLPLFLELGWHSSVTWSGYVAGGTLLLYVTFILPLWLRRPNAVIFIPSSLAGTTLYLLYICLSTGGRWFMSFAFPVTLTFAAILTTLAALLRYVRRGALYSFGGTLIALGAWTVMLELLIRYTFNISGGFYWSFAPLTVFCVLGLMLIVIAIVRPLRESLRRIFFIGKV